MARLIAAFALVTGLATGADATAEEQEAKKTPPSSYVVQPPPAVAQGRRTPGPPDFRTNVVKVPPGEASASSKFTAMAATDPPAVPLPTDVGVGDPKWQGIEIPGEPLNYFRYFGLNAATTAAQAASPDFNNEILNSVTDPHRPEVGFTWQPSVPTANQTQFSGYAITNQPDQHIFWFDPATGKDLGKDPDHDPNYRSVLPSEFTISSKYYGVKGMSVEGAPQGNAPGSPDGSYALAFMYVTDREYSDGNNEYGFFQELASTDKNATVKDQPLYFYYSTRTNCYQDWGCRSADDFNAKAIEEQVGGGPLEKNDLMVITNVRNYETREEALRERGGKGSPIEPNFYYSAYMVPDPTPDADHNTGYKFRMEIVDGYHTDRLATCSINGGPDQPCAADVKIQNFFPAQQMQTGSSFVNVGTQTAISGDGVDRAPKFDTPDPKFKVKSISLSR